MNSEYTVRLLTEDDVEVCKSIRLESLKNDPAAFGGLYEEEVVMSDDDFKKNLREIDTFGLFYRGKIIGSAGFAKFSLTKMSHNGELSGMYVDAGHRGKGVAAMLLNAVIEHARPKVLQLYAWCISGNPAAIKFYQKHGFQEAGINPRSFKVDDKFYDTSIMILSFD